MRIFLFFLLLFPVILCAEYSASVSSINDEIFARMTHSWRDDNPVPREDLRYLSVVHWGYDGKEHTGEVIVHSFVADELIAIFEELYTAHFPIEKMRIIDEYDADDDRSMADNNSSAFCSRPKTGTSAGFSLHSYGLAIDINPLVNPYVKGEKILPPEGAPYVNRDSDTPGIVADGNVCYSAFVSRGWDWGGHWEELQDYQHFCKAPRQWEGDWALLDDMFIPVR